MNAGDWEKPENWREYAQLTIEASAASATEKRLARIILRTLTEIERLNRNEVQGGTPCPAI